jgi:ankyrin repeat protein
MKADRIPLVAKLLLALAVVFALLPCGVSAEDKDTINRQLITAVKKDELDKVKTLLARGADVNAKNRLGITALLATAIGLC